MNQESAGAYLTIAVACRIPKGATITDKGEVEFGFPHPMLFLLGNVEKSRQRRSRHFAVLTYSMYAPRVNTAAALLDELFSTFPPANDGCLLLGLYLPWE